MNRAPEELFAEIYRDHAGLVGRTVQAFAQESADRAELFQDILIALWQALPQFTGQAKLSTYVYRVAFNTALNWQRSRRRYRQKLANYVSLVPAEASSATPQEDARLHWLYARIRELPPVDRSLILLLLDGVGYRDIADITGLSESNVGVRLHRIKQHLSSQSELASDEL
jgi:RNA polymerase sigma-70 factor (ECF subfamily)